MRQVAGKLRLDLAQYRELAAFAQFASDLDKATRDQLTRGEKLTYALRQPQFAPVPVEQQVAILWAATNGYLDDVESARISEFESGFYRFLESTHKDLLPAIAKEKAISDDTTKALEAAVKEYREQSGFGTDAAEPRPAEPAEVEADTGAAEAELAEAEASASEESEDAEEAAEVADVEEKG
jgi:F-type H+-transporting ATPase subunit alpha